MDHAGANPSHIVRLADYSDTTSVTLATSTDGGSTWAPYPGAPAISANVHGGKITMSAQGDTLIWTGATGFQSIMRMDLKSVVIISDDIVAVSFQLLYQLKHLLTNRSIGHGVRSG